MDTSNWVDNGDGTFTDPSSGDIYTSEGLLLSSGGSSTPVYQGTGTSPASGGGDVAAVPPAGAVGKDATGTNWIDSLGRILAPVAVSALTPYLNNLQSGGLLSTGTGMLTNAGNALNAVNAPDLTRLIPQLQLQVMQGNMTPAQAAAAVQQASAMGGIQTDQASLQGQRDALTKLAQLGNQGGMSEADRAALAETMNQTNANAAQQRAAQIQQLQMQGNAGTGAELAARLSNVQGTANTNAATGAATAQAAQARALQALQSSLAGQSNLNTQQFNQQAQKAQAQDLVNQFNAQAQQSTNLANAGYQQQAGLTNFNTANQIAGVNTGIMNTQAMLPYQAAQSNFTNQTDLAKAKAAAGVAAGAPLVKAATDQIARSSGAGAATAAGGGATTSSGGGQVDPLTGLIKSGISNAISGGLGDLISGAGDLLSNAGSDVASWFGFKDGGYVEPHKESDGAMSDQDVDHLMAKLTAYKYRRKA